MKKLYGLAFCIIVTSLSYGQCDLDFGSGASPLQFSFTETGGSDIVNGGSGGSKITDSQSFDIWDETTNDCSGGGGNIDITFDFEILETFDQYSTDGVINLYGGASHEIDQSSSGLKGKNIFGSGSLAGSAGDVRGYQIKVSFADHVIIEAQDMTVNLTSANTAATGHESYSIVFFDENKLDYGTATYEGYYDGANGASTDGLCTAPAKRAESWSTTGVGTFTASSTASTDISIDPCDPTKGANGPDNNKDVNAQTDAGLAATDRIGGFTYIVYLEDVAASSALGASTTTSSSPSSTLNGISIASLVLPVELVAFNTATKGEAIELIWSTASEKDNDYFDVEWSLDGSRFEKIGEVQGQGNSFEINHYRFIHSAPVNAVNYYRLKQVDLNGRFEYSEIRSMDINKEEEIRIYPTLVSSTLNLIKPKGKSNISIYAFNGSLIQQINGQEGQLLQISTNHFTKGSYLISVQTNNRRFTQRFSKF